jgi:hypothetical protein
MGKKHEVFYMKWIIILLVVAAGVWAYLNVDFANLGTNAENTLRQEKTLKVFFNADQQNKEETQKTIQENF